MWCKGSAGLRSSSYYEGCLSEPEPPVPCSWRCWDFTDLEASLWLWKVEYCSFFSVSMFASTRRLIIAGALYKGR